MGETKINEIWTTEDLSVLPNIRELSLPTREAGIYFLSQRNEIVYIGKSIDVHSRIASHRAIFPVHRAHFLPVSGHYSRRMHDIESAFIKTIQPAFNIGGKDGPLKAPHVKYLKIFSPWHMECS